MSAPGARDYARQRYIDEYSAFEDAADFLRSELNSVLKYEGVSDAYVNVRAKEVSSFVKKLRKYGSDCWQRTTDKVGAQVVVHTLSEVRQLRTALEACPRSLQHLRTEDKSLTSGDPHKLQYSGIHIQVALEGRTLSDGEPVEAEIQLRTEAQDVWSYLEHHLVYKPVIAPSPRMQRKVARLSVLVEMFDEEVETVLGELADDPRYESALLLQAAERWFLTFVSEPGETELSLEVLDLVGDAIDEDERSKYAAKLATFVHDYRPRIADAMRDYGAGTMYVNHFDYFLFTQPELLVILERLQNRRLALRRSVTGTDVEGAIATVADVWGTPLST